MAMYIATLCTIFSYFVLPDYWMWCAAGFYTAFLIDFLVLYKKLREQELNRSPEDKRKIEFYQELHEWYEEKEKNGH
jgi:hypothetical protein